MKSHLKDLYNRFYTPRKEKQLEDDISECHKQLIDRLGKPERKLVLQIIDDKDCIAERLSYDSFIAGFHLAWSLLTELHLCQGNEKLSTRQTTIDCEGI